MINRVLFVCVCISCFIGTTQAQQLVYHPINPAFGGDTFNYQWLLSSAQVQNKYDNGVKVNSPLDNFQNSLNSQILNQISQRIVGQIFGEGNMKDGTYQYGQFKVNIQSLYDGISVTIGSSNGNSTNIKVPWRSGGTFCVHPLWVFSVFSSTP